MATPLHMVFGHQSFNVVVRIAEIVALTGRVLGEDIAGKLFCRLWTL